MTSTRREVHDPFAAEGFARVETVAVLDAPKLCARFEDGEERVVDSSPVIECDRWFRALAVPTTFETIHDGRGLQWITGADCCADALCILAHEQRLEAS